MKKFILVIAMMLSMSINSDAQTIVRNGNTFTTTSTKSTRDTLVTKYSFEDSKGIKYPIIIIKNTGHCYVWKKSGKTGKMYKMYFSGKNEDIARQVAKELGIKYIESTKKSK